MGTLSKRYKKYSTGSDMRSDNAMATAGTIGAGAGMVGSIADALGTENKYGKKSSASNILGETGKYTAMGATFGPWGALVGAAVGAGIGIAKDSKQKKEAGRLQTQELIRNTQMQQGQAAARIQADPTIVTGNMGTTQNGYFATGGSLAKAYAANVSTQHTSGGTASPLNSSAAEFRGNSHAEGGIQIPGMQAEVEGKETTNGSYVFSDELGFAKLHKPIAKAIGIIEKKALTPERVSSIKLLKDKENQLKLSQEYTKQKFGLN